MSVTQAVLLVGGRGTRLWPLTDTVPKGLVPVAGRPFVELQLGLLEDVGVKQVILAVGSAHADGWRTYAAERSGGLDLHVAVEDEPLDTAGPLVAVRDLLEERFLVLNGDVVVEADLGAFVAAAPEDAAGTLCLVEVDDPSAYGVVVTDDSGMVERFVEKPPAGTAPAATVNAGIYLLAARAFDPYRPGPLSFERVVFPALADGGELAGSVADGRWLDIGTAELYLETNGILIRGESSLHEPGPSPHVDVSGGVAGAVGGSWSWVGDGATVAAGATVSESIVLPGASIAAGAVIDGAVIGWEASVGSDARITGAAVVGAGAVIGTGVEVAAGARVGPGAQLAEGSIRFTPPS